MPLKTGAVTGPCNASVASTTDRMPSRKPQPHVLTGRGDVEFAQLIAAQSDPPAKLHGAAAELPVQPVKPNARGVEGDNAIQFFQRVRKREVAQPASVRSACPDTIGRLTVPPMSADTSARPELRTIGNEALQRRQVRCAIGLHRQRLPIEIDAAGQIERGVVADEPQRRRLAASGLRPPP